MTTQTQVKDEFIVDNPTQWGLFNENKKEFLRFNVELEKLGFKKVVTARSVNDSNSYDALTLVVYNTNIGNTSLTTEPYKILLKTYPELETYYLKISSSYESLRDPNSITYTIGNTTYQMGKYIPEKNLIWICPEIYACYKADTFKFILETLQLNFNRIKWKTIEIDRIQELCDAFLKGNMERMKSVQNNIDSFKSYIKDYSRQIRDYSLLMTDNKLKLIAMEEFIKSVNVGNNTKTKLKELEDMKAKHDKEIVEVDKMLKNSLSCLSTNVGSVRQAIKERIDGDKIYNKGTFKERIEELYKLPFVKNMRITREGEIKFEINDIKIKYGNKVYNMGNYTVFLTGKQIWFEGDTYLSVGNDRYYHPHIHEKSCCLGTFKPKMYELLYQMRFADLAVLIKQFLNTYTPNDHYLDLAFFTGARRNYEKFENADFGKDLDYVFGRKDKDKKIDKFRETATGRDYRDVDPSNQVNAPDERPATAPAPLNVAFDMIDDNEDEEDEE